MGSERRGLPDEVWAELDRYLGRLERERERRASLPPKTPEEKQAAAVRRRLQRLAKNLEKAADTLQHMHSDRSGNYRLGQWPGALLPGEFDGTPRGPGLKEQFARVQADAAQGCAQSARFMEKWAAVYALCEDVRHQPLPERAPDYDPREGLARPRRQYPGHSDAAVSRREFRWDRLPGDIDWENEAAD